MPTSKQCPFKEITIEGVRQSIKKGVVNLAGTPSGWSGTFRWNVGDTTPEEFEKRIMEQLLREPTGSLASSTPVPRDVAALAQTSGFATPGYLTPRNMSPPSDRPEVSRGNISGSKKKLSPQSAEVLPEQKRASSSRSVEPDELMAAMPFVTSSRLRGSAQCSEESAMSTGSTGIVRSRQKCSTEARLGVFRRSWSLQVRVDKRDLLCSSTPPQRLVRRNRARRERGQTSHRRRRHRTVQLPRRRKLLPPLCRRHSAKPVREALVERGAWRVAFLEACPRVHQERLRSSS
jgi:hypothetical protein